MICERLRNLNFFLPSPPLGEGRPEALNLAGRSVCKSFPLAPPHLCSRNRLRKSASYRRAIFPVHPFARKRGRDYRQSLSSSRPLTRFPSTLPRVASLQDQASQVRCSSSPGGSSL